MSLTLDSKHDGAEFRQAHARTSAERSSGSRTYSWALVRKGLIATLSVRSHQYRPDGGL